MAQRLIPVRPSPLSTRKSGRRPGPPFSSPTRAESSPKRRQPFIADQWLSVTLTRTKLRCAGQTPKTLGHSLFLPASLLLSEQRHAHDDRERERWRPAGSRSEVRRRLLARSLACDVHPKVSTSPSSQLMAMP
jgi:hypothetical protein